MNMADIVESKRHTRPDVDAICMMVRGVAITTGASSAYKAIPDTAQGTPPNRVRLSATANAYARLGVPVEATVIDSAAETNGVFIASFDDKPA
jgi:hypothetical protein